MEVVMKYPTQYLKNAKNDIFDEKVKVIYYFVPLASPIRTLCEP